MFGVYLPADVVGSFIVSATASDGTACGGYRGTSSAAATITAGGTASAAMSSSPAAPAGRRRRRWRRGQGRAAVARPLHRVRAQLRHHRRLRDRRPEHRRRNHRHRLLARRQAPLLGRRGQPGEDLDLGRRQPGGRGARARHQRRVHLPGRLARQQAGGHRLPERGAEDLERRRRLVDRRQPAGQHQRRQRRRLLARQHRRLFGRRRLQPQHLQPGLAQPGERGRPANVRHPLHAVGVAPAASDGSYWLSIGYSDGDASLLNIDSQRIHRLRDPVHGQHQRQRRLHRAASPPTGRWSRRAPPTARSGSGRSPCRPPGTRARRRSPSGPTRCSAARSIRPAATWRSPAGSASAPARSAFGPWPPAPRCATVPTTLYTQRPTAVAFSPDGTALAVGEHNCGKLLICAD